MDVCPLTQLPPRFPRRLDPTAPLVARVASLKLTQTLPELRVSPPPPTPPCIGYIPTTGSASHVRAPASCQRDTFRRVRRDRKRGSRVISVGVQSAAFHRGVGGESECDKRRGPPAEALHRRCRRWTPPSPVVVCKRETLSERITFPTCSRCSLVRGTRESFDANSLQSGQNLSGWSSCWSRNVCGEGGGGICMRAVLLLPTERAHPCPPPPT